jgi:hypothetical protein
VKVTNDFAHSCKDSKSNDAKVQVFFQKDSTNNPDGTVPNWFYYWRQIPEIQNLLNSVPGFLMYDRGNCRFDEVPTSVNLSLVYSGDKFPYNEAGSYTMGANLFNVENKVKEDLYSISPPSCIAITDPQNLAIVSYGNPQKIEIGEGCGYKKLKDVCNTAGGEIEGIHAFYSTVAHEVEHARITSEVWNFTHLSIPDVKAGYMLIYDRDRDNYKDIWEELSPAGLEYKFNPDPDEDGIKDRYHPDYLHCFCTGTCSAGTQYEETRCRNVEKALNLNAINAFDWSYDMTNTHQGKQW